MFPCRGGLMLLLGIFWLWLGWSAKDQGLNWDKNSSNREYFSGTISEVGIDLKGENAW